MRSRLRGTLSRWICSQTCTSSVQPCLVGHLLASTRHSGSVMGADAWLGKGMDQVLVADRAKTVHTGWVLWRSLADLAGWDVPDRKSPEPTAVARVLGATSDLTQTPNHPPTLRIEPDRARQLTDMISNILHKQSLAPGVAAKLWGKLGFASTQMYGRFGRAKLRAIGRRQYEPGRTRLNPQLRSALLWWLLELPKVPDRVIPTRVDQLPVTISYSDGEGAFGQIGVAIWRQGCAIGRAGVIRVPKEVRDRWDPKRKCGRYNDIFEVEALGPLVVLTNFADVVRGSLWLHLVDNAASSSTLVSGSSSVESGDLISGLTWSLIAGLRCLPWFDRVDTHSNPVDGLSRGKLEGRGVLEPLCFPSLQPPTPPKV